MKLLTKTLAAFAALALSQSAMASDVYFAGSTAFRTAIMILLQGNTIFDSAPYESYVGTSSTGATYANFTGTIGGTATTIKVSWSGSAGGIFSVVDQSATAVFLADTYNTGTAGAQTSVLSAAPTGAQADNHAVDMCMADCYQSSSVIVPPNYNTLAVDNQVGIVVFKWVGNYSLAQNAAGGTPITNISAQQVQSLYAGAYLAPAYLFTGGASTLDTSIMVFPVGRDFDSGTRINAFADSGLGSTYAPYQWQPYTTNGSGGGSLAYVGTPASSDAPGATDTTVTQIQQWNAATLSSIKTPVAYTLYGGNLTVTKGNGGFASGGDLAKLLRCDTNTNLPSWYNTNIKNKVGYSTTATGAYFISYLGASDAATAIAPATTISLTGVALTSGSPSLTCASTTGCARGQAITGTDIPVGTYVLTVNSSTSLTLTQNATATVSASTASIANQSIGKGAGVELSYNGVYYSNQAIEQGQYSYWSYEHLDNSGVMNTVATAAYNKLLSVIPTNPEPTQSGAGLLISNMAVQRGGDGQTILGISY